MFLAAVKGLTSVLYIDTVKLYIFALSFLVFCFYSCAWLVCDHSYWHYCQNQCWLPFDFVHRSSLLLLPLRWYLITGTDFRSPSFALWYFAGCRCILIVLLMRCCLHCKLLAFLSATAATAVAHLSHRSSVRPSVCPSVTRVDQSKTVQARITKFSPSAAWKTLVSGTVKLLHKFEGGHPNEGAKWEGVGKICDFQLIRRWQSETGHDALWWVQVKHYR